MILKLFVSFVIILCSTMLGTIYANTYIERTKLLGNVISTLQMLETEIVYGATPLPILLERVSKKSRREIANIFERTVNILNKKEGYTFAEAWRMAIEKETKATTLNKDDIDLLLALGNSLGISDREDQVKHIRLTMEEVKRNYELAIIDQNKNVRLFKNLGFLLGIVIVIIFF